MALIKCIECGKEISSNATSCPHCGNPMKSNEKNMDRVCEHCGGLVANNATSCVHCEKKLDINKAKYIEKKKTNTLSIIGFIFGGISFFIDFFALLGITAVILCTVGSVQIKNKKESGMFYAVFGFLLGIVSIGYTIYRIVEYEQTVQMIFNI